MKRTFVNVIFSIVVFCVFSEMISLGWYFFSQGELFYLSNRPQLSIGEANSKELITEFKLHPYFGYVGRPNLKRNNHGFFFSDDYPLKKSGKDEYFIGVFGGSVAENFAIQGGERLVYDLKQHPFFRDKDITVLNFSLGGYKQPQQLLILDYYLAIGQELDLVINIDGFNEVALSSVNSAHHIDISMPSVPHIASMIGVIDQTTLTSQKVQSLARIDQYKTLANRISAIMNETNSASVYFVLKQFYKILYNKYANEKISFEELETDVQESMIYSYPKNKQSSLPSFEDIAFQWANSSIMMSQILRSRNILYFHFLQPNQYYSKKDFGPKESFIALNKNHPYRASVENGYPVLLDKSEGLRQSQVNFFSAIAIFDNESRITYIDDCCHYNQTGNQILADFIANAILAGGTF